MPAEISFYVLASESQHQRQEFACKLIEKIYRSGQYCYVLTDDFEQAQQIDQQLWTFRPASFVPHQLYAGVEPEFKQTVLIGSQPIPVGWQAVIVNLSTHYPPFQAGVERILEILDNSEASKQAGRERYRHYQQAGLKITTYKI